MSDIMDDKVYVDELREQLAVRQRRIAELELALAVSRNHTELAEAVIVSKQERIEQLERELAELKVKAQGLQNAGEYLAEELRLTREVAYLVGNMGSEDLNNKIVALRDAGR